MPECAECRSSPSPVPEQTCIVRCSPLPGQLIMNSLSYRSSGQMEARRRHGFRLQIILVEAVRKPGSVPESGYPFPGDGHSSGYAVTGTLKQPTRRHGRAALNAPLFGLAPDGVYLASDVTAGPGELLPHPFTLTCRGRRTSLCGTYPWGHPRWTLSSVTPYGARTFLHRQAGSGHLDYFNQT